MAGLDGRVLSQQWGLASGPIMATRGMAFRRGLIAPLRVEPAVIGTFLGPERAFEFWPEQDVGGGSSWELGRLAEVVFATRRVGQRWEMAACEWPAALRLAPLRCW
jgi:hypothetical protein